MDRQEPGKHPTDGDHIESHIGDGAQNIITGKDINSLAVSAERGVGVQGYNYGPITTGDGNTVIIQRLDLDDARNQRNHKVLRQLVRKFWVDGVLKHSLYNEILIRLDLEDRPDAVDNRPWDLILQQPGQPDHSLLAGTPIINVFDQMNQLLLILGEPGAGKTTMLLELADALLKRADADPTHPTPVVFNLSSWAEKRLSLAEWLVEELRTKYNIGKRVSQAWVEHAELLPLLDGLDEMAEDYRDQCAEAINEFRREHLVPLVVTSRLFEYEMLTERLKLQGAISLKGLSGKQVNDYFEGLGIEVAAIKAMLQCDTELRDLVNSPLMLSIVTLAYRGTTTVELPSDLPQSAFIYSMRQRLFDAYIQRMLIHRGVVKRYSNQNTLQWIAWLAANMSTRQETIFLVKNVHPSWMRNSSHASVFESIVSWLVWIPIAISSRLLGQSAVFDLILILVVGLSLGFGSFRFWLEDTSQSMQSPFLWRIDRRKIETGLFGIYMLYFAPILTLIALFSGLISSLLYRRILGTAQKAEALTQDESKQGFKQLAVQMLVGGSVGALAGGLTAVLFYMANDSLPIRLIGILMFGMTLGLVGGAMIRDRTSMDRYGARIQNLILRPYLWRYNYGPFNYTRFLDYCHDRIFLRKVGGGYIFIHRMLLEHFAQLTEEDIERIAAE